MKKLLIIMLWCLIFSSCIENKKVIKQDQKQGESKNLITCDNIRFAVDYSQNNILYGLDIDNWAYIYEKNIVFDSEGRVKAYEKKDDNDYTPDYYHTEKTLYTSPKNTNESLIGLFDHWLFVDGGTSPGPRVLKIIDLNNGKIVFDGEWYSSKKIIDQIDDTTFIVYKYNNDRKYKDNNTNDIYTCTLSAYAFNVENSKIYPLNYSVKVYGQ